MKLRISISGMYIAMDMEEEQARKTFRKLAEQLWIIGGKKQCPPPREEKKLEQAPAEETLPDQVPEASEAPLMEAVPEQPDEKIISPGYGGFLYIKCPVCGKVKGFCAKTRISNFRCECGCVTKMKNMVLMIMKCECGRQARYLTNMEEPEFDITCYDCGAPVAVRWNDKEWMYKTM